MVALSCSWPSQFLGVACASSSWCPTVGTKLTSAGHSPGLASTDLREGIEHFQGKINFHQLNYWNQRSKVAGNNSKAADFHKLLSPLISSSFVLLVISFLRQTLPLVFVIRSTQGNKRWNNGKCLMIGISIQTSLRKFSIEEHRIVDKSIECKVVTSLFINRFISTCCRSIGISGQKGDNGWPVSRVQMWLIPLSKKKFHGQFAETRMCIHW